MSTREEEVRQWVTSTFDSASDYFDHPVLDFWNTFGRQTVDKAQLQPGMKVLDVCSGSGASVIPAAKLVGPKGEVVSVDLAEKLQALAIEKAEKAELGNIEFRCEDMTQLDLPENYFDAVVCVFGIFFVPDMEAQMAKLWSHVKPGGRLIITNWGANSLDPFTPLWNEWMKENRPDLIPPAKPWERVQTAKGLIDLFEGAGIKNSQALEEPSTHPFTQATDWWYLAMGSGFRGVMDILSEEELQSLGNHVTRGLESIEAKNINTDVVYGWADK